MTRTSTGYFQAGYVVSDLESAIARWLALGVGPFFKVEKPPIEDYAYRGSPAEPSFRAAIAQHGELQLELIQPLGDGPSVYSDVYPSGTGGFHHLCQLADDVDAEVARLEALGYPVAGRGTFGGAVFAYVDTVEAIGHMSEFVQPAAEVLGFFEMIREAARDWDGSDPIRDL